MPVSSKACASRKSDLSWIGNKGAMVKVDRANGEVFAQTTAPDGSKGYYSCLIVNKKSPLQNLDDMFAQASKLSFSNGDPNSTSGFLVPGYYVFAKNGKDPQKIFARTVSANHEANALSVANNTVDVATCNNEGLARLAITAPEKAKELRVIWKSPLIPSDPLVWRKDLPEETKKKITDFIFSYGVKGENVEQARQDPDRPAVGPLHQVRQQPADPAAPAGAVPRQDGAGRQQGYGCQGKGRQDRRDRA